MMTWCLEGVASEEWQLRGDGIRVVDRKKFRKGNCSCRAGAGGAGGRAWFGNGLVGECKMERRISCFVIMEPFKP